MGFLSGVLSNIKDHLGQHKGTLDDAISILNTNKHGGKKGFDAAIEKVVEGVGRYNDAVRNSNNHVKNPIEALLNYVKEGSELDKAVDKIPVCNVSKEAVKTAVTLVEQCRGFANVFHKALNLNAQPQMKIAVEDLNPDIQVKIDNARKNIGLELTRLTKYSQQKRGKQWTDLETTITLIEKTSTDLGECVNVNMRNRVTDLVRQLKTKVEEIKKQLEAISKNMQWYIDKLNKWIVAADEMLKKPIKDAGKIEMWLPEAQKQDEIRKQAEELKKKGTDLYWKFSEAKENVEKNVKKALEQVKVMNDKLKMDLYGVKERIKTAVKALGKTLDKDVKQDLTALKDKITGPLGGIVKSSQTFSEQFTATQKTIDQAIGIVEGNMQKLQTLSGLEDIDSQLGGSVILLNDLMSGKPFQPIIEYFTALKTNLMTPLKDAMGAIGEGTEKTLENAGKVNLENAIQSTKGRLKDLLEGPLKRLQSFVKGGIAHLDRNTITIGGTNVLSGVSKLDVTLANYTRAIDGVVASFAESSPRISKGDVKSVITELGDIAEAVSEHSKEVVDTVMGAIQTQMQEEISEVASAINAKLANFKKGIERGDGIATENYGVSGNHNNSRGLQWLVSEFDSKIKGPLEYFQSTQISNSIFKTSGLGVNNYDLETVMSNFHGTYEKNLKEGDIKINGGAGRENLLDQEIGGNLMTEGGGVVADRISNIEKNKFPNYDSQVKQDSLSAAGNDPNGLEGEVPTKIKNISKNATSDFEAAKNAIDQVDSFTTLSEKIKQNLTDVMRAFEQVGKSINSTLKTLKVDKIGMKQQGARATEGSLQEIQQHLSNLKTFDLNDAIQKAKNFFEKEAIEVQTKCIQEIEKHVNSEVKKGRDIIIAQVRANYVTSVKELLQQFSSKVIDELKHLPTEITQDADKKFKGFMKEIETQLKTDNIRNALPPNAKLATFAGCISNFFGGILHSLKTKRDIMPPHKIPEIDTTLNTLLNGLSNYNKKFVDDLSAVNTLIDGIHPESYSEDSNKLLDILTKGLRKFHDELVKAYISIYDSEPWQADYSSRYAKVCLTIIHLLGVSLPMLRVNCKSLSGQQINKNGDLGKLLAAEGYHVSERGEQNGELQDKDRMKGDQIQKRLTWPISGVNNEHLKSCESTKKHDKFSLIDIMSCLVGHLGQYNDVCHIAPPSKGNAPCNVYQMLCWLDGLPHSPVYQDLIIDGFSALFEKPGEQHKDVQSDDLPVIDENADTLDAYPKPITAAALRETLREVCNQAHNVLTAILGYGHAGGVYACEFTNNSQGLVYPNDMNSLMCTLVDVLRRLHYQLYFICQQCLYNTELGGWRDCWYGKEIGGSNWKCNNIQCANQDAGQKHNQTCDQKCNQKAECGIKSPLQSFLEDGLPGFLPHLVTSKGPKMSCGTCARASPGMPCLTPMGFSDISNLASHRRKGQQLYMALTGFCSSVNSPLTKLCSMFNCIIPSAPKTLDYMFAVFYQLLHGWDEDRNETRIKHTKEGFNNAVNEAYFNDNYDFGDVSLMFKSKRHAAFVYVKENEVDSLYHHRGNLYSIFNPDDACYTATMTCGAYISPICLDAYSALTSNHGKLYVSWIIYTIEKFYDLLCQLCKKCTGNCTGQSKKCRVSGCAKTVCNVDAIDSLVTKAHSESCNSIVQCPNTLPTLYTYGFTYGNRVSLNGLVNKSCVPKRTCKDFSEQLNKVCSQASVLSKLIHVTIPEFLFRIRLPFMSLVVALWSLSLFYLICVMVGRLDVLHIRSHLRIPSSHRITAQSLLAAAQVGRLAKISYLQP